MPLTVLTVLTLLTGLVVAGLLARVRRGWVLVTVDGRSMLPTLRPGERVLVRRVPPTTIRTGHLVVVESPIDGAWRTAPITGRGVPPAGRRWMVKRVAAGPGDPVPAEALDPVMGGAVPDFGGVGLVPPGRFLLLGDNREVSLDSRTYGFVPAVRILGLARPVGSAGNASAAGGTVRQAG